VRGWLVTALVLGCSQPPAARRDEGGAREARADRRVEPGAPLEPARASEDAGPAAGLADATDATPDAMSPAVAIVDAPMAWSERRERLTLEYRRVHSDRVASDLTIVPRVIVLHYTGGGSAKGTRAYFDNVEIEASRKTLARAGKVNVSAHFVVDRDGTIYRLQPETRFARHCIGLNHLAIGIENVGDEDKYPLTDAQIAANVELVRDLVRRFPSITHLLGHHEVMGFRGHPYYVELDGSYANRKGDPGPRFMTRVREQLADLALARD
jgi:N-acetylmuramoyl-L-alanine amidase